MTYWCDDRGLDYEQRRLDAQQQRALASMSHRCETCGVKDGHAPGCVENIPPEDEPARADCGNCYGNGCGSCNNRGWVETDAGREAREAWEDGAYDRARDARLMGED